MSIDSGRVYGDTIDLDGDKVKEFFNKRATDFDDRLRSRNTTVLLGDNDSEYAENWDSFEKERVLPILDVKKTDSVLDIGCGVGRWAESLIPLCGDYTGTDLSEEMVRIASDLFSESINSRFINASFQDIFENDRIIGKQYQKIIIAGVSMYLNDDDLKKCYEQLDCLLAPEGIVYMEESIGTKKRLSLNNIWSDSLEDHYSAVYRTVDEYKRLLFPLTKKAQVVQDGFFSELDKEELSETGHWFIIIRKTSNQEV